MGKEVKSFRWALGDLPFIWGPIKEPHNGGDIPDFLPFTLSINQDTGTLIQLPTDALEKNLETIYYKGSQITGMMDDKGLGKLYADDFLHFVLDSVGFSLENKKVLEIGCGTGYLLHQLKEKGATVLGVEPGQHAQLGAEKYGVSIFHDFFPSSQIEEKFDLIISYNVLEHIKDLQLFLDSVIQYLKPDGLLITAVPDESEYILHGDISTLFHQHYNYFTAETLIYTLEKYTNKQVIQIKNSKSGGILYSLMDNQTIAKKPKEMSDYLLRQNQIAQDYRDKSETNLKKLENYFQKYSTQALGIYVPWRAINALTYLKEKVSFSQIRFFDDDALIQNTFFPGFDIPIEPGSNLKHNKVEHILIMSSYFSEQIAFKVQQLLGRDVKITTWKDIFSSEVFTLE